MGEKPKKNKQGTKLQRTKKQPKSPK